MSPSSNHTQGLGTAFYAAPEQLEEDCYDTSVDIYSSGIILFEMHCKYESRHEFVHHLKLLKKQKVLPEAFQSQYPSLLSSLIMNMVDENPKLRPSANEIICTLFIDNPFHHYAPPSLPQLYENHAMTRKDSEIINIASPDKWEKMDKSLLITEMKKMMKIIHQQQRKIDSFYNENLYNYY